MKLSTVLALLAGVLGEFSLGLAQVPKDLLLKLEAAKRAALDVRVKGILHIEQPDQAGAGRFVQSSYEWAYAAGKEHEIQLAGRGGGYESLWDGERGWIRTKSGDQPWSVQPLGKWPIEAGPIKGGYVALAVRMHGSLSWVVDIAKLPGIRVETTPKGLVRLHVPTGFTNVMELIELNPKWGYMINSVQSVYGATPDRAIDSQNVLSTETMNVVRAQKIGACWIPTAIVHRSVYRPGSPKASITVSRTEFSDITGDVPDSDFASIGRPGEMMIDGTGRVFGNDGKLHSLPPAGKPSRRFLVLLAVLVALGFAGVIASLIRRRARRPGYWGPRQP